MIASIATGEEVTVMTAKAAGEGRDTRTETPDPRPDRALIAAMATNLYALMNWLHEKRA